MGWGDSSKETTAIVRGAGGEPKLWLAEDGELHDALGPVRVYEGQGGRAAALPAEETGPSCPMAHRQPFCDEDRQDTHPKLRALVYELTPSAIEVSDEGAVDVVLS